MYQLFLENTRDIVILMGLDGNILEANKAACQAYQYTAAELCSLNVRDLQAPNALKDWEARFRQAAGEGAFFETVHRRKDSSIFPVEVSSTGTTVGGQTAFLCVIRDITERRQARDASAKLATIVDMLPDILYFKDADGVYQTANRAFEQFVGRPSAAIVGKTDFELLPPDLAAQCSAGDQRVLAAKAPLRQEEKMNVNGEERYFDTIKVPLYDEDGTPAGIIGVSREITESIKTAAALRASRETLSLAAELAHLGPWKFHPDKNVFEFGDEFYAIYGTTAAREGHFMAPGVYAREFMHPDDVWMVEAEVNKARTSDRRRYCAQLEHRIIRRDGKERVIAVLINVEKDDAGKVMKWYGANQDITERMEAEKALRQKTEEVRRLAYTDALTGLPNRMYLNKRLAKELEEVRRGGPPGAVLFVDLDDLKLVNDAFGHTYGDALIVIAGSRIVEKAGAGAFVGRIGGDEFMVILPGEKERANIARIAGEIIGALSRDIDALGVRFALSASAGIAVYPRDGNTAEEIFKNADNAMYAAKKAGKNCWRFYVPTMQAEAYDKVRLTNSLRRAMERGELSLQYQPLVEVDGQMVVGFEALLRWNSREHGAVTPARFIPLAEQNGLIHAIGEWVLREACLFAGRLADAGWGNVYVSVNVSPHQLCAEDFIGKVRAALDSAGVEPRQLELEITENALVASLEESIRTLGGLRAMGVRLALDDFGTGYSSLTYLQRLPVNTLKIDKAFIDQILAEGKQKSIIANIVDMAHTLDMSVVAEGVEAREQLDYLACIRCDYFQGYIASPPISAAEAESFLGVRMKAKENEQHESCT